VLIFDIPVDQLIPAETLRAMKAQQQMMMQQGGAPTGGAAPEGEAPKQ
jgi:hypothetical protein